MNTPLTFAEGVGKALGRFAIGAAIALAVVVLCALIGIGPFLSGWFGCMAWNLCIQWGRP